MDWSVVFSGIAAAAAVATLASQQVQLWQTRRKEDAQRRNSWELLVWGQNERIVGCVLTRADTVEEKWIVRAVEIVAPRGALLMSYAADSRGDAKLQRDRPLVQLEMPGGGATFSPGSPTARVQFGASLPEKPPGSAATTSLSVRLHIEVAAADRRRLTMVVKSEQIPWSANKAANTT